MNLRSQLCFEYIRLRPSLMKEYKTVSVKVQQGWGASKATVDVAALDETLNDMAKAGWELACIESLEHSTGSGTLLCVFSRETQS